MPRMLRAFQPLGVAVRKLVLLPIVLLTSLQAAAQNSLPQASVAPVAANPARDIPYPGTITLEVDATNTRQGIFRVREIIPVVRPGRLTLRYAQWLPGNHAPTGPIEAVAGFRFSAGGREIAWRRNPLDVFAFDVDVPAGVSAVEVAFDYLSNSPGTLNRVEMTREILNLQWEKVALYPAGHYVRQISIRPAVTLPPGWTGVSAIDGQPRQGRIAYQATDFETMVDSPMFAGRNFRQWPLGHEVDLNVVADRPEDLAATDEQIAAHRRLVEQSLKTFGGPHFDRYDFLLALSDELSAIGLEHHRSSENAVGRGYFTDWANQVEERTLLPHEFSHSWNGKYRRPAGMWAPDYHTPTQNSLLWVYEGQADFWQFVLGARAGMISKEEALGEIASKAAYAGLQSGRSWRQLSDTTLNPIIGQRRRPAFPSYQRGDDYYGESSLIWLEVDMLIRQRSNGKRSIDDFARAFFGGRSGDWGTVTYTFDEIVSGLNGVVPYDWAGFLRSRVEQPSAPLPVEGIRRGGYKIVWRTDPNVYDQALMKGSSSLNLSHSIGATIGPGGVTTNVIWNGPMFAQGVAPGATVVAVDGREYSGEGLKSAIGGAAAHSEPIRLLIKEGSRYRTIEIHYRRGLRWPHLQKVTRTTAMIDQLLTPLP